MAEVASAYVSLVPSARGFGTKLRSEVNPQVNSAGSSMGKTFGKAFAAAGALMAAAGIGSVLKSAISEASGAQQSIGATESIFKSFADTVIASSKEAAQEYGLSANEYRESANLIGSLFKNQGVELDELAGKTDTMIGRAADLSAMFGGTTAEAVESLSSAFKGEFNPLEKYGITLNATAINAELAARGHADLEGAALAAAKQQATMDLIMRQSKDSMGTFADEANTLAGQQQRLSAQWTDMKAALGTALLPALTNLASFVNASVLPAISGMAAQVRSLFSGEGGAGGLAGASSVIRDNFLPVAQAMVTTFQTQIIPALIRAGTYVAATFGPVLAQLGAIIRNQVLPILGQIGTYIYGTVYPAVVRLATAVGTNLRPIFDQLAQTARTKVLPALQQVLAKFQEWWPTIQRVIGVVGSLIGRAVEMTTTFNGKVLPVLIRFAGFIIKNVVPAVLQQIEVTARIIGKVIEFGRAIVDRVKDAAEFVRGIKDKFGEALDYIKGIPGKIETALSDLYDIGKHAAEQLVQGLIDVFKAAPEKVGGFVSGIAGAIADRFPGSPVKTGPLTSWNNGGAGKRLMDLLRVGIEAGGPGVVDATGRVAEKVAERMEQMRDRVRSVLDGFRSDFASLRDSIASTFTGNLFDAEDRAGFLSGLAGTAGQLLDLKAAFKKLMGWGISPQFLAQLFQSGNGALILDLAGGSRGEARVASDLFGGIQSLGQSLGAGVARNEHGDDIRGIRQELRELNNRIERLPGRTGSAVGRAINGAVGRGQRRAS